MKSYRTLLFLLFMLGVIVVLAFILALVAVGTLHAQSKPAAGPVPAPLPASYEFDTDSKLRIRELQYQNDQLEIEIQKMEVQIAQKKSLQGEEILAMKQVALEFANKHNVPLDKYVLDPAGVRFVKK